MLKPNGKMAVKAKGYVGVFALKDSKGENIILIVEPKVGVKNVVWMLAFSEARNFKEAKEIESVLSIPTGRKSIVDLLVLGVIRRFMERLSDALTFGFVELPLTRIEEGVCIRGRILSSMLPKTLLNNPIPKVAFETQYYTVRNPVNHYILDACYMIYLEASYLLKIIGEDPSVIVRTLFELDYIPSLSEIGDTDIYELLTNVPLDRLYMHELLKLAAIIKRWLEYEQPPYPREFASVPALYINMNDLFESFIRKMLIIAARRLRRIRGLNITVRKAGRTEEALVVLPKPKVYLKPDVVIEVNGKPVAVGDVKYKLVKNPLRSGPEGDRDAINQVYTYMHGWDVSKGFLIYPSINNRTWYEHYVLKDGGKLYVLNVYMEGTPRTFKELQKSEFFQKLSSFLVELAEAPSL